MKKIVVRVVGGMVQELFTSADVDKDIKFEIIDEDSLNNGSWDYEEAKELRTHFDNLEEEIKYMRRIF